MITGDEVPKQFCALAGEATLLDQTRQRVALAIAADRTLAVVVQAHERFYAPVLADLPEQNIVVQPANRGTAPAILYSLLRLAEMAAEGAVAIFPSDHFVSDDDRFMRHVDLAFRVVAARPASTVLLGIRPDRPESAYGWMEPAEPLGVEGIAAFGVRRFWEKPKPELTRVLWGRRCLWNSFVIVARVSTLLDQILAALPGLYFSFDTVRPALGTRLERRAIRALYADLISHDFSAQVLARNPHNLAVLPVAGLIWDDLGEPRRVLRNLERLKIRPGWAA